MTGHEAEPLRRYLDGSAFTTRAGKGAGLNLWLVGLEREGVNGVVEEDESSHLKAIRMRVIRL